MSEQAKKGLVPELRFPEFRDSEDWVEQPVGSVCEVLNNQRKPVTSTARVAGEYPYYGASGIVDYIDDFIFNERLLLVGEDGAKWGAFEPTAFIAEGKYWVNNHAHVLRPVRVNDTLLASYLTMLDLQKFVTGAAPPKLTLGKLKEIPILFPKSPDEQKKIAACLSSLDTLLAAERAKLEALRDHKQGLMQQLFPVEGVRVPALRFPGFEGEWKPTRLGDIGDTFSGLTGKSGDDFGSGSPFVTYKQVFASSFVDFEQCGKVEVGPAERQNAVRPGDILFTTSSETPEEVGFASVVLSQPRERTYLNSFCFGFRVKQRDTLHPGFSRFLFHSPGYRKAITTLAQGITRYNISKGGFLELVVRLPVSLDEQQAIDSCLASLEEHIAQQAKWIAALADHRQGLMQGLFPNHAHQRP